VIDSRLRLAGLALALAGVAIAGYLTWVHYADAQTVCVGGGGACERGQGSDYAELAGIPVALVGLVGYVSLLIALTLPGAEALLAAVFLGLVGVGFSAYLTYVELVVIDAICQWCVASAVVITAVTGVAMARYLRAQA
jgi:uncharacterized membrane protein